MLYNHTTNPNLIESIRDWSEEDRWQRFYNDYAPRIRTHARACGLSESDAEEVVQESMLRVARNLATFRYDRTVCRFRTWLAHIVHQRICDLYRRRKRDEARKQALNRLASRLESEASSAGGYSPFGDGDDGRMIRLEVCLANLRSRSRAEHWQVFEAYALHGLSGAQVARLLLTTPTRVWVVYHRMVRTLRQIWQNLPENPLQ